MGKYLAECLEHGLNSYIYSGSMVKEFVMIKFSCSIFKKNLSLSQSSRCFRIVIHKTVSECKQGIQTY